MSFDTLLDRLCTIESNARTQDAAGQKIKAWSSVVANIACRLDAVGGGLLVRTSVVYEKATHELFMREQSGLTITTKEHRIVIGSDNYTILLISDIHGFGDTNHLELILELQS